jgi:hypothetical protein
MSNVYNVDLPGVEKGERERERERETDRVNEFVVIVFFFVTYWKHLPKREQWQQKTIGHIFRKQREKTKRTPIQTSCGTILFG